MKDKTLPPVIAIDGPSGSGKGTLSYLLARHLGWHFLDSGLLYRVLAWAAITKEIALTDEVQLSNLAQNLNVEFKDKIYYENQVIQDEIRTEQSGNVASKIAVFPGVREALLKRQWDFRQPPGLVADGRDMGTVVFKDAFLKIFLEASQEERAKRRYLQLKDVVQDVTLQSLLVEIEARDRRDKERVIAPLKPAEDAVIIDTTGLTIERVLEKVQDLVKARLY